MINIKICFRFIHLLNVITTNVLLAFTTHFYNTNNHNINIHHPHPTFFHYYNNKYDNSRESSVSKFELFAQRNNKVLHCKKKDIFIQKRIRENGHRILYPNNIIYPSYFPLEDYYHQHPEQSQQQQQQQQQQQLQQNTEKVSLYKALNELQKAMKKIIQFESEYIQTNYDRMNEKINDDDDDDDDFMDSLEFMLGSNDAKGYLNIFEKHYSMQQKTTDDHDDVINDNEYHDKDYVNGFDKQTNGHTTNSKNNNHDYDDDDDVTTATAKYFTIRIEQPLSHPVDPLCWLHANINKSKRFTKRRRNNKYNIMNHNNDSDTIVDDPIVIYLANAENTMETAVYGSSLTIRDLNVSNDVDRSSTADATAWDIINNLPMGSRVYGGSRFDKDLHSNLTGDEWKEFGKEMWVLPAIELRRERNDAKQYHDIESLGNVDEDDEFANGHVYNGENQRNENYHQSSEESYTDSTITMGTTLSINLHFKSVSHLIDSAKYVLSLLQNLSHTISPPFPDTTLPPILSRGYNDNAQEVFEIGVTAALENFRTDDKESFEKVVLARRSDLHFGTKVSGLDVLMKIKFGASIGGHLFYMSPGSYAGKEFFGCAPERLFQVRSSDRKVISEALAGTRPRGSTSEEDKELLRDLMYSKKDRNENIITGEFIRDAFNELKDLNLIEYENKNQLDQTDSNNLFFIRRLRHLQHICQSFDGKMKGADLTVDIAKFLLNKLHPTPAVCGYPMLTGLEFIRQYETSNFDRGMYAGPFGCIGRDFTDIIVAIRSGLLMTTKDDRHASTLSIYAGAGIVPGSSVQEEWSETGYKLGVLSSFFAQSPLILKSFPTSNEAWATSFIEELIRSGIMQYYICPGSRSTPLTTALARAARMHVGVIECISVHDERAAAFRAVGYARSTGKTAAVITSSGTAVANLYPAVVESSMDGIPMLLLTADRPYENRDIGANQSIDQLKVFSETYIRWFRDIAPPSDDVPISLALSDANHAAKITQDLLGPVHLNIQFRENLAPESGPIRGDNRDGSFTSFSATRFTDVPGFERWSFHGSKWADSYGLETVTDNASKDLASLITNSKRGIIVIGNIRDVNTKGGSSHSKAISALISDFATFTGFPIFAGAQCADIRFQSEAVVPYAEHLLKHPIIKKQLKPDLVIQFGSALISTEVQDLISQTMKEDIDLSHVLIHSHRPTERVDPAGTVTDIITSHVTEFLPRVLQTLEAGGFEQGSIGSQLAPLVHLGRELGKFIPTIIHESTSKIIDSNKRVWEERISDNNVTLSEPQIVLALAEVFCESQYHQELFLSNSMPVRDADFFLYPITDYNIEAAKVDNICLGSVAVNRGASGIDGIISTATGYAEGTLSPTTLVIGDLATLHDINAFHHLSSRSKRVLPPLTTIVVNNDGGGIFSFLPIAKFGSDVSFEQFFGTPTNSYSFGKGAEAFGLKYEKASSFTTFKDAYEMLIKHDSPTILEAKVTGREENVKIHKEITLRTSKVIDDILAKDSMMTEWCQDTKLTVKFYRRDDIKPKINAHVKSKVLVLLHGWMGDKNEWDDIAISLMQKLPDDWSIVAVDIPGHGDNQLSCNWPIRRIRSMLSVDSVLDESSNNELSIDNIAQNIMQSLSKDYNLHYIDGLAGYSLGGRIALAMKKISSLESNTRSPLLSDDTQLILLGSYPGNLDSSKTSSRLSTDRLNRKLKDQELSREMFRIYDSSFISQSSTPSSTKLWLQFLTAWYGNSMLWADIETRNRREYQSMAQRRIKALTDCSPAFAHILEACSPGANSDEDWKYMLTKNTHYLFGELDKKYSTIAKELTEEANVYEIPNAGHALLVEAVDDVSDIISTILSRPYQTSPLTLTPGKIDASFPPKSTRSRNNALILEQAESITQVKPGVFDMELFVIELSEGKSGSGLKGIGWGEQGKVTNELKERRGFIISFVSDNGQFVGIGEVSPLNGVHPEKIDDVEAQLKLIQNGMLQSQNIPAMACEKILALDGSMDKYLDNFITSLSIENLSTKDIFASVRSGLEMSLMSLASETVRVPLPKALLPQTQSTSPSVLPINGLVTRGDIVPRVNEQDKNNVIQYPSIKVKVGHRLALDDAENMVEIYSMLGTAKVRADANRAWNQTCATAFANEVLLLDKNFIKILEFVEEPLEKQVNDDESWSFGDQVTALEQWHEMTSFKYALDESLVDIVLQMKEHDFGMIEDELIRHLSSCKGCAALILKPTAIGMELSIRLAKMAHEKLGIGVVFTSTFESGVGLAFTSFLATLSDSMITKGNIQYPHGMSTFSVLNGDTLSPPFESYVKEDGTVKVSQLGRAIYGLGLDELRDYASTIEEVDDLDITPSWESGDNYQAMSSETGREISIQVSLPLPFSDDIACNRFTDLPQQPRWSPWLNSVSYLGKGETEWKLKVRGVEFRWKAISHFLEKPKGIMWESTSGLKNKGRVEFIKVSDNSCLMKLKMTIRTPRIIATVFKTSGEFVKEFVENKLLKWSLESFRDVVKADLALERGEAELGDALYGAVEGRSNAIEATLSRDSFKDM